MNNDLEQFSEEYLKDMQKHMALGITLGHADVFMIRQLIDLALAAKQAKPKFEEWMSTQSEKIEVDCGCVTTEAFYHWLKVAYEATPQPAHTEQDDTRRMDWLVSQNVEVRTPMPYGSHARFVAQCDSDDCEEYHTTLREQIDKAMLAAAPKPESEL